jgi:hypothetical protein
MPVVIVCAASVASFGDTASGDHITAGNDCDTFRYVSASGKHFEALLPKQRLATDYTPLGFTRQPSFVRGAGMLNKGERALVIYADGDILPPALMLQYRYGLLYWWDVALEAGGDAGVFQTFVRTRMENLKTRRSEAFFWSNELSLGYKIHDITFRDNLKFDDRSIVISFDNSLSYRIGKARESALYLLSVFYEDYDLHNPRRQTDYYILPAILGFETMAGDHTNFFIEAGAAYSINGMQLADGTRLYKNSWFPLIRLGIALRTGSFTAVYYTRETMPLSRGAQPKPVQ